MIDIYSLHDAVHLQNPRRIPSYVIIWCGSGTVELVVDEYLFELKSNEVITITSGQVHCIKGFQEADGLVLEFTLDFFCKDDKYIELIFHNGSFCHFTKNEVIQIDDKSIEVQLRTIHDELERKPYQYLISAHSRTKLILVEINRAKVKKGDEIWVPDALFLKFLLTAIADLRHNYSLEKLAQLLGTTELKLNEQAKLHTGKTAQQVIYGLIISEAKRLLTYDRVSVKQVAYQLGFNDPFYFSNFFKKITGFPPKTYQQNYPH